MLYLCIAHRSVCQSLNQELFKFMALKLYFTVSLTVSDNARSVKITNSSAMRTVWFSLLNFNWRHFFYAMQRRCVKYSGDVLNIHTIYLYLTQEFCLHICSHSSGYFRIILFPCSPGPLFTALVLLLTLVV